MYSALKTVELFYVGRLRFLSKPPNYTDGEHVETTIKIVLCADISANVQFIDTETGKAGT